MTKKELEEKLTALFIEYGAVIEGYDYSFWSREDHLRAQKEHGWTETFEETAAKSAHYMVGE